MGFLLSELTMPALTIENAIDDICTSLTAAIDTKSLPLLVSAQPGMDAVLWDSMLANPRPDECPCVRVNFNPMQFLIDANVGGPVQSDSIRVEIYVLYYVGVSVPNFNRLRNRHIRMLQDYLRLKLAGNTVGITFSTNAWQWDSSVPVTIDSDTPFKYINEELKASKEFSCTRIDRYIKSNWAQNL